MTEMLRNSLSKVFFSQVDDINFFKISGPIENIKDQVCEWKSKSRPFVYEERNLHQLERLHSRMLKPILDNITTYTSRP